MKELTSFLEHVLGRRGRQSWVPPACSATPASHRALGPAGGAAWEVKVQLLGWAVLAASLILVKFLFLFRDAGSEAS